MLQQVELSLLLKYLKLSAQISSNAAASSVNIGTKGAFVDDNAGERASITSLGSDEKVLFHLQ